VHQLAPGRYPEGPGAAKVAEVPRRWRGGPFRVEPPVVAGLLRFFLYF